MRNKICLLIAIVFCSISCNKNQQEVSGRSNDIIWKKTWGSEKDESVRSLTLNEDGSFVVMGTTSFGYGGMPAEEQGTDCWLAHFDSDGTIVWEAVIKEVATHHNARSIIAAPDNGYVIVGDIIDQTSSNTTSNTTGWIAKLNNRGEIHWQKNLGPAGGGVPEETKTANAVAITPDGGYIVAGGEASSFHDDYNFWVIKLNSDGEEEWQNTFGGAVSNSTSIDSWDGGASSIAVTADGGYIIAGVTATNGRHVTGNHGSSDYWIVKLDSHGKMLWQKALGGSEDEDANSLAVTPDGGYIVAGFASSQDGDVQGVRIGAFNYKDIWVVKLDQVGQIEWQKALGGWEIDEASSISVVPDGGYILTGTTSSNSGDVSGNHGYSDYWVVKLNGEGEIVWQKTLGGQNDDEASSIAVSPDGDYIVAGSSWSNDGDVSGNRGFSDAFIVKINKKTNK